jgi:ABC-2 type transport system ATP-binding protein/ribosome-dependent ATPase
MTTALARADQVTRLFGEHRAVQDVSLTVHAGEIVGLVGANGAGKTTLIRMLMGLARPTTGSVRLFGRRPDRSARARLGYVPQGLGLWTDLTVHENVTFAATAYRAPAAPLTGALAQAADRPVGRIGLGLQRQLAFAIAMAHEPELLVLDEPTSGVDPLSRARLWDTIHSQAETGVGVLVSTHYLQEAQQCDQLVVMSHGRTAAAGTESEIVGATTAVNVSTPSWAEAFTALDEAGFTVTLAGRDLRVAGATTARVAAALDTAGTTATIREVPATLEEVMTMMVRSPE